MRLETFKYLSHPRYFLFNKILVSLYDISKARTERHLGLVCKQNVSSARHQVVCSSLKSVNHLGGVLFDCFFVRKKPVLEEPFFKFLLTKKKWGLGDFFPNIFGGISRKETFYTETDFEQDVFGLDTRYLSGKEISFGQRTREETYSARWF